MTASMRRHGSVTIKPNSSYQKPLAAITIPGVEARNDGDVLRVEPMTAILIKPGCRHRAVGKMRIVNVPIPAFDPDDEWFD